tara:strand:- start:438 stop:587 length:150 start_codon:yes stop_codon:yes gene_type:complete
MVLVEDEDAPPKEKNTPEQAKTKRLSLVPNKPKSAAMKKVAIPEKSVVS